MKIFLSILLIGILTLILLPRPGGEGVKLERKSTIFARIKNYRNALRIFHDYPIFGVGFNTYRYAQKQYGFLEEDWQKTHSGAGIDSSLLFVLATGGIIGLLSYLNLLRKLFLLNLTDYNKNNLKLISLISLASVLIHSFFNNSLFYPWIMLWLWILFGISEAD